MRLIYAFPAIKGISLGIATVAVVQSGLTDFQKALVISIVSGLIGVLGMVVSSIIQARSTAQVLEAQAEQERHLEDIKGAVGADKRTADQRKDKPK